MHLSTDSQGAHSAEALAEICDAVRLELERTDMIKYVNTILTAYVVKSPPDHEAGLSLLLRLRGELITPVEPPTTTPTSPILDLHLHCRQ